MKATLLFSLFCFFAVTTFAQTFAKEDKVISLGVGIGSSLGSFNYSSQIPALSLVYEQGIATVGETGVISLGGYIGYKSFGYKTSSNGFNSESKWNYTILGARGAFHFSQIQNEKLDLYAGVLLSYNLLSYSYEDNSGFNTGANGSYGNSTGLTLFGGARYFFTDKLAGFAELGYGISYLNVGLSVKL
ncbi:hypothetical protein [Algoriphagus mannitolivorans]|uniref:hypothetical protein n=1 Tax=Algoriphagus mannitolivorans TaxID=226504 RepID=UPI0003F83640|nr:hypothetical protein [Algoriphagus mannitolivorans]